MAMEEIKLWVVQGAKAAVEVPGADRTESERMLEDVLVANPNLLMTGLALVGRQMQAGSGPLDLLGVDGDGRLVVFELKRGTLSRDAVAQVLDYGSWLESLSEDELAQRISDNSGARDVEEVGDFRAWYESRTGDGDLGPLRPVKMVLVGLGADEQTNRMVRFLADRGIEISLLTFHGYVHEGKTLLARQVRVEAVPEGRRRLSQEEASNRLERRIEEQTEQWPVGRKLWDAALDMFRTNWPDASEIAYAGTRTGRSDPDWREWPLYRLGLQLGRRSYAAVQLAPWGKGLEVIFLQAAVKLCLGEFTQLRKELRFYTWPEVHPERDTGVIQIKFRISSLAEWRRHKAKLTAVTRSVYEAAVGGGE